MLQGEDEIVPADVRKSAITSQSIGVAELADLLRAVAQAAPTQAYVDAVLEDNVLGVERATARENRLNTLQRLYQLRRESVLFRALRDLWPLGEAGQPLLAGLCAMTRDTVFRSTAELVAELGFGEEVTSEAFAAVIDAAFPGAYRENTLKTTATKAAASWEQTGHLTNVSAGKRARIRERVPAACRPSNVAYALLLGHLQGHRGEALFETVWARVLDRPRSQLMDLAVAASQQGMVEFRSGGGVIEVGFAQLLRPMEGQLL
jgi:hypothetical protein